MNKIITKLFYPTLFFFAFFSGRLHAQAGASLDFDGGNDYVSVSSFSFGANWTTEAWVNPSSVSSTNWQVIMGQAHWNNNQGFVVAIQSGTLFAESPQGMHIETSINPNVWTHVALSYNSGVFAFYKNGILVGTQLAPFTNATISTYIGSRNNNNNSAIQDYYYGVLDEIRVWAVTRSQCEIQTFMNCEIATSASSLIANYHFNQGIAASSNGTVTSLLDDSGNSANGALTNFGLSGSTSNWITPGAIVSGYTTSTVPNAEINITGNGNTILDGDNSPSTSDFTDFGVASSQTFVIESTGAGTLNAGIPFFTGVDANQFSISIAPSQTLSASSGSTSFVITFTPTSPGTKTATLNIYNSDCSEPIYDFVITATAIPAEALSFDGLNDGISRPVFSTQNSSVTLQAKVLLSATSAGNNQAIVYNGHTGTSGYGLFLMPGSREVHVLYGGIIFMATGYSLTLNQWTSLSLVLENNMTLFYVNGVLDTTFFIANPTTPAGNFMIGVNNLGTENFNGQVDEVLLWNKALSQCEIQTILSAEITTTASGLVANYHFNQGIPSGSNTAVTILVDAAGSNTATLSNFALTGGSTSNWISPGGVVSGNTTVTTPSVEINIIGLGNTILDGAISTSTNNATNFGSSFTRTFVIQNTGTGILNLGGTYLSGTNASDFTITSLPSATIGASTSTTLVVVFTPTSAGSRTAVINIISNDCDEAYYDFVIKADGTSSALDFDGTSDWVSTGIDADTDVMPNTTWLAWVYPTSYPSYYQMILSIDDGGWDRFISIYNNEIRASNGSTFVTVSTFTTNQWVHLGVVYKQATNEMLVYVNGIQYGPYTTSFASGTTLSNLSLSDGSLPFQGKMDEVRIWNTARSQCEILTFKDCEVPAGVTGLVANYHFNNGLAFGSNPTFTTLSDFSGNNNHGTLNTFSLTGTTSNWINTGAIALGYTTASVPTASINITGNGNNILNASTAPSLGNHTDFGTVSTRTFVIQNIGSGTLFINSPINFSGPASADFSVTVPPAATLGVSGSTSFVVTFSPTALGTRSVLVNINSSDCTYPNYVFAIQAFGVPADALSFDGSNDYVSCPNMVSTFSNGIVSAEAWVMTEASGGGYQSILKNWGETITGAFHFGLDNTFNYPEILITQSNGTVVSVTDPNPLSTGIWYHLAFVADGTQLHLFKNGIEVGIPANYNGTLKTSFAPLYIGAKPNDLGSSTATLNPGPWNGKLDEIRLWSTVRSQCQIQTFMNCEIPTTAIGLVSNYHFNQGVPSGSNSAINTLTSSALAQTGTLTNFALSGTLSNWVDPGAITAGYTISTIPSASIGVTGNGNTIPNGSASPTTTNFTDLGVNATTTFVIQNTHTGTSTLNVGPIFFTGADASQFTVSVPPSSGISANGSSNFVITFTPTSVGSKTAIVNIRSSDCSYPTYSFVISASATPASALNFDGSNDYVQIVDPNFGTSDFTLETWVNVNSFTSNTYLMSTRTFEGGASGNYWDFGISAGTGVVYFETANTGPAPYTFIGSSSSTIALSSWNHLAVVRSGLNLNLYINGILKANTTYTSIPSLITGNNSLRLSGSGINLALLSGSMDEVRIWNAARSQCQIQQFMNAEITSTASGLIANYHFNQGVPSGSNTAITSLIDATGVNTGTLTNFSLTGTASNWIVPSAVANNFTTAVAPTATLNVYGNGNLVPMGVTTTTANYTDFGLATNRTFLVHNIGSGTLNAGTIFFSGANASNFSVTSLPSTTIAGSSNSPFIISFTPSALGTQSAIVNITSNDCTNPTFSFVITASTSPAEALDFDGTDDFVAIPSNTAIPVGNSPYCIEAWIKPNAFGTYGIIGWGNYSNTNQVNAFRLHPSGLLINYWWGNDISVSVPTLTNGAWHHVAATFDGTMRAIYVDGIMAVNDFPTGHSVPNNANMRIGCTAPALSEYFNGKIDEVRVWNTSRSQCQIQSFMNCEIPATATGLVLNYHFNQGVPSGPNATITTLNDAASSINGTLNNFTLNGANSNWVNPGAIVSGYTTAIAPTASINITGNGNPITPGSSTVSLGNFTDFGTNSSRTFVIQNSNASASTLYINSPITISGNNASDFTVSTIPSSSLGASANTSFIVTFTPIALGTRTAIISINSSDCSNPNYSFVISASATPAAALNFDGLNDVIQTSLNADTDVMPTTTWEAWIYPTTTAAGYRMVYSIDDGGFDRYLSLNGNQIRLATSNPAETFVTTYSANQWYHLAVVYEQSINRAYVYVNGIQYGPYVTNFSSSGITANNFMIGANINYINFFEGNIDEVRVWSTARTQCEIQTFMNCEIPTTAVGLVANYHFNQGIPFGTNTGTNVLLDAASTFTGALTNFSLSGTSSNWVTPGGVISGSNTPNIPTATMSLSGNGNPILAGSTTATLSNFTDFQTNATRTFVIQNSGTGTLSINSPILFSGAAASNFSVTTVPSASLGTSSTTSFVISYSPTTLSTQTAIVIINSSDCSSPNYSFVISASATPAAALNFDGVNDHILIPNNSGPWNIGNNFTIETWIKPNTVAGTQLLLYTGYGCIDCPSWALSIGPESTCSFSGGNTGRIIFMATDKTTTNSVVQSTASPTPSVWTHVAVTGDGSTLRMYVNGLLQSAAPLTFTIPSSVYRNIGADPSTVFGCAIRYLYSGDMDELRFWNVARSQCQIQSYMNCEIPSTMSGLTANYHFNQGIPFGTNTGTNVLLDAAATNTGVLTNFSLTGTTSNWVNPGGVISGSNTPNVPTASISVFGNGNPIIAGSTTATLSNFTDFQTNLTRTFVIQNTGGGTLSINLPITFSGSAAGNFSVSAIPASSLGTSATSSFVITYSPTTLSTQSANVIINSSDCSSPNYSFVISASATPASALNFDGLNDYVEAPHIAAIMINSLVTVEAWVKPTTITGVQYVVSKGINDLADGQYGIVLINGVPQFHMYNSGHVSVLAVNYTATPGVWAHYAGTWDGSNLKLYINGLFNSSFSYSTAMPANTGSLQIGRLNPGGYWSSATIDELRIWNIARTQCEIQSYMNAEITTTASGLVANYHFNSGIPSGSNATYTVLTDVSGNNNHGTLINLNLSGTTSNWINPGAVTSGSNTPSIPTATLSVLGNSIPVLAGSSTPTTSNFTDFGSSSTRIFILQNTGSGTLNIQTPISLSGANATDFSITGVPSSSLSTSATGSLTLVFIPSTVGTKTAIVSIVSSDCANPTYSFVIKGTASAASALNFDGTNDFVSKTVFNTQTNNVTFQARVNWNGVSTTNKFIVHNGNSGTNGYGYYVAANTNSVYVIFAGINVYYTGCNLTPNQWTALSMVLETNKISFYANGALTNTVNPGASPSVPSGSFNIGVGINQGVENFNGSIDEVLLWNKALNQCEIQYYLNCEIPSSSPSLIANYHFNQAIAGSFNTTFTTVADASGNNNTLTLTNFGLSGITSNWINPGAVSSGSSCGVYSESEINVIGNAIPIIDGATTPTLSNHTDFGNISSNNVIVRTYSIQNTGTSTLSISSISLSGANASQFTVGSLSPASPVPSGSIAVFSVTFIPTSSGSKSATVNISNNDCDESLFDFVITGSVNPGTAFSFDGNNDYINIGNILTSSYTKETWVNISTSTNGNNFLSSGSGTVGTALWAPGIYSYKLSAGHNVTWNVVQDPTPLVPGTWYHVAVTYDAASGIMTLYKNGVSVSSNTVLPFTGTDPLSIGAFSGSFVTTGYMDEVRIWNRPLCQAEIVNNMNCEIPTSAPGLIANYHFNQGIGNGSNTTITSLTDASGANATGTLVSVALTGTVSNWSSTSPITTGSSCAVYLTPEINLVGNNTSIVDGDITPSLNDHTDFSGVCINNSIIRTYTIQNTGNTTLTVSSQTIVGTNASQFSISALSPASPINAGNQSVFSVTFTPTGSGVKTATINIVNSDCNEGLYDFVITGTCNALPVVIASSSNSIICNTFSTSVFGAGADTYTWSGGVTNNIAFTPSITSSYTVNGTNTLTGCTSTNSAVQSITVNATPTITAISSNSVICFGSSSSLSAFGASTYTWQPGALNGTSISVTPSISSVYSVTGTSSNACVASNTVNLAVTVNTLPVVGAATTDSVICLNFSTSLLGSGANTYTWSGNIINGLAFTPTVTQTYSVNGTNTLTGCTSTNTAVQTITVNSLPTVSASTNNSIICEGFTATLTAAGANTYTWLPGSLVGSTVTPSPFVTTDFTLTGTSLDGCTNTNVAVQSISVNTIPTVSAGISSSVICLGGTVSLIGSGAKTYTWSNGVSDNTAFTPTASSSYTVNGTNTAGCTNTNLATVSLTVNSLPVLSIQVRDSVLCFGDTTNVKANGALTYVWSGGITNAVNFTPTITNTYTVFATDLNTCTNTAVTTITVNALPILTITSTQDPACIAQTQTLSAVGALTYTWSTLSTVSSITIAPLVETSFSLIATDLNGCVNTSTFVQQVMVCEIVVYSGISANGDGLNDVMTIQNIESYPQNKVSIFNRWGKEVFSIKAYNNRDKAWPLPEDVSKLTPSTYFYVIDLGDGSKPTKGWVELIKN